MKSATCILVKVSYYAAKLPLISYCVWLLGRFEVWDRFSRLKLYLKQKNYWELILIDLIYKHIEVIRNVVEN